MQLAATRGTHALLDLDTLRTQPLSQQLQYELGLTLDTALSAEHCGGVCVRS